MSMAIKRTFSLVLLIALWQPAFAQNKKRTTKTAPQKVVQPSPRSLPKLVPPEKLLSRERYYVSGALSIFPGLGIGHAVQGRWLERGWIFSTLSPVVGVLWIASTMGCHGDCSSKGNSNAALFGAAYIGLRVWEIYDAWAVPDIRPDYHGVAFQYQF